MIVTLEQMKQYLRLEPDDTEEDALIEGLLLSAEEYIKNATGFRFEGNAIDIPEIAKLIVKLLVSHWYENRSIEIPQNTNKISFAVDALLVQLTYSYVEVVVK